MGSGSSASTGTPPKREIVKVSMGEQLFYYHSDHLGSTGYVTRENGKVHEHIQYFPFGETWVQQGGNTEKSPYLFTSKELDEETGLYYYGARYYDPKTSVWQSADPILEKYLPSGDKERDANLSGIGGIYNSANLGLYTYSHQRPVVLSDPDGKEVSIFVTNEITGKATAWTGPNQTGSEVQINTYRVIVVHHETGATKTYNFTRDTTAGGVGAVGNYGNGGEAPPGQHEGALRTDRNRVQLFDTSLASPDAPRKGIGTEVPGRVANPTNPNSPREVLQFHGLGMSEGCLMSSEATDFNSTVDTFSQVDQANNRDIKINVYIFDRTQE